MTEKSELKLAEWSEWGEGTYGDAIVDVQGTEIETDGPDLHVDGVPCKFADALAAIRAVDGDPEYLELVDLRRKLAAVETEIVQETEHDDYVITKDIDGDTCAIGRDSVVQFTNYGHLLLVDPADEENFLNAPALVVLTVLRAAGRDPEYLELVRMREENEALAARCEELRQERDDLYDQIVAGKGG